MPSSISIDELMLRWEEARRQGKKPAPEELCADSPHLLDELRGRIKVVVAMEGILGVTDSDPQRTMFGPSNGVLEPPEDLPTINGYEMIRVIGHGGMGVVYEAKQVALGRLVAIKMIASAYIRTKVLERFKAEAEAAARLQHPNFVQIFEVGQVNGRPFFSMEYVTGGNLAERMTRRPLTPREAGTLIETLARAIHAAHQRGIVHRDLKPSNVMLDADGTPKITDFGLAKRLDDDSGQTNTGEVLGTPSYMAPEQAEGQRDAISPATDVYALGAILYELITSRPPFQGSSPLDSLRQVVSAEPIAPSHIAPSVPRDLEAICLKCLEKSPSQRYASALALADDLRRFLDGQPVTARRIGPVQRLWRTSRRHPMAIALGCAVLTLALIPFYFLSETYRAQQRVLAKAREQAPLVREILQRNCYECHGQNPKKTQKFDILNNDQLLDGVRVVPGDPEHSLLIQRIKDSSMPPEKTETRLPSVTELELTILSDWILGGAPPLPPDDPAQPTPSVVPYSASAAKAKAIFRKHCYDCHRFDNPENGGIKIMNHRLLVNVRKVVIPSNPEESKLHKRLTTDDVELRMPLGEDPLSKEEIADIRRWIEEGAPAFSKTE